MEYQCGRITEEQYFTRLASDFGYSREEMEEAILAVRRSLRVNEAGLESLVAMKARFDGRLKFYAVINLSQQDYALVKGLGIDWSLFEQVFVSSEMGMQKPELRFYQRVLDEIGLQAGQVILVDDETDSILAALSMGLQGILCSEDSPSCSILNLLKFDPFTRDTSYLHRKARPVPSLTHTGVPAKENLEVDSIERGTQYLQQNAQNFPSYTHTGVLVQDNFAQLIILDLTGDRYVGAMIERIEIADCY